MLGGLLFGACRTARQTEIADAPGSTEEARPSTGAKPPPVARALLPSVAPAPSEAATDPLFAQCRSAFELLRAEGFRAFEIARPADRIRIEGRNGAIDCDADAVRIDVTSIGARIDPPAGRHTRARVVTPARAVTVVVSYGTAVTRPRASRLAQDAANEISRCITP